MTDTLTPVDEMEGRELDAAVAVEVFGDPPPDEPPTKEQKSGPYIAHSGDHWMAAHHVYKGPYWSYNGPAYSTDIAAAWKVVGELVGAPDYAVAFNVSPWPDGGWLAGFCITDIEYAREQGLPIAQSSDRELYDRNMVSRGGESLQWDLFNGWGGIGAQAHGIDAKQAICRAALKAVRS